MPEPHGWFAVWLAHHVHALTLWIAALTTLGLYTVLYKENKIYRLFEHMFLGLATGYLVATVWTDTLLKKWWLPMWADGKWWLIFALSAGSLYYFIYSRKYNWLAHLIIGFFLGVTSGQAFQLFINDTWPQIASSFKPVLSHGPIAAVAAQPAIPAVTMTDAVNNAIFMVILVCVISYFFFSFEQKNAVIRSSAKLGRWMMMFAFGAIFGATMMARLALLIDRMDFLFNEFSPQIGGPNMMLLVLIVLVGIMLFLVVRKPNGAEDDPSVAE